MYVADVITGGEQTGNMVFPQFHKIILSTWITHVHVRNHGLWERVGLEGLN